MRELNTSLDYESTLATVARIAVPSVADWCAVDMLEGTRIRRLAVAHVDPEKVAFVDELGQRYGHSLDGPGGVARILRTGKEEMFADLPDEAVVAAARDEQHLRLLRQLAVHSYIGVPILRGEQAIGAISFARAESARRYDEGDLQLAIALADRAAVAIENARLYGEAERARRDAELASRSKDEFLAMLGHELRNPLAPIQTALELMKLHRDDALVQDRAIIERQLKHVVRLVDDLLDVSRITRGKVTLARERVEIAHVIADAFEISRPLLDAGGQVVTTQVPRQGLVVDVDRVRMAQVLSNLLSNAAKYTEAGGRIQVLAEREGAQVVVRVRDSGVGITAQMLPRIFELFVQERQAIDRSRGGLGLGLSIVSNLVALHGGQVSACSEGPGRGSEFIVRLEAASDAGRATAGAAPIPPPPAPASPHARVLIVDDNEAAALGLAELLELHGFTVRVALDGATALATVDDFQPQAALLDIGLPIMDGFELARRLRAHPQVGGLQLIAITGYGRDSDRKRSREAGFDHHLVKPIEGKAVVTLLEAPAPAGSSARV